MNEINVQHLTNVLDKTAAYVEQLEQENNMLLQQIDDLQKQHQQNMPVGNELSKMAFVSPESNDPFSLGETDYSIQNTSSTEEKLVSFLNNI